MVITGRVPFLLLLGLVPVVLRPHAGSYALGMRQTSGIVKAIQVFARDHFSSHFYNGSRNFP